MFHQLLEELKEVTMGDSGKLGMDIRYPDKVYNQVSGTLDPRIIVLESLASLILHFLFP